jgi:GntR family transcriptional regulator
VDEVAAPLGTRLKHVQVREYVRDLIEDLPEGAPAPSERGLMQHFGVARMTVRQAIDALVTEGLLERAPARGTYVCKGPPPVTRPL